MEGSAVVRHRDSDRHRHRHHTDGSQKQQDRTGGEYRTERRKTRDERLHENDTYSCDQRQGQEQKDVFTRNGNCGDNGSGWMDIDKDCQKFYFSHHEIKTYCRNEMNK